MTSPESERPHEDDGLGALVRRVLSSGPTPEERLEEMLASRRREFDEHAARLAASIADLERREELLRDSRASVERMLRLGTSELEAREAELADYLRALTERETHLADAEADLARRRRELGAVELRRAALERRERAVEEREDRLREHEDVPAGARPEPGGSPAERAELAFIPGAGYRLLELGARLLTPGERIELDGVEYVVARLGPSPLPRDERRCAFLLAQGFDAATAQDERA